MSCTKVFEAKVFSLKKTLASKTQKVLNSVNSSILKILILTMKSDLNQLIIKYVQSSLLSIE